MQKLSSISDSWKLIMGWLVTNAPSAEAAQRIQRPVSVDELKQFSDKIGITLPKDFTDLYAIMNGTDPNEESVAMFPSEDRWDEMAFGPMALKQILHEWKEQKELQEGGEFSRKPKSCDDGVVQQWWNFGWIPFATNGGGDYYCIDTTPTAAGTHGQVITHSHETGVHKILAPSLSAYLAKLSQLLASQKYQYDDENGLILADADTD